MIDTVLCISRRISSLLTTVLSPAGSFCDLIRVLHDCSLYDLLSAVIPVLQSQLQQSRTTSEFCFSGHSLTDSQIAAGPRQHSNSWFRVQRDSWPLMTIFYCVTALGAFRPLSHQSQSRCYVTTGGQSAILCWCRALIWGPKTDSCYGPPVAGFFIWAPSLTRGRFC
jgi:hypothetical protein